MTVCIMQCMRLTHPYPSNLGSRTSVSGVSICGPWELYQWRRESDFELRLSGSWRKSVSCVKQTSGCEDQTSFKVSCFECSPTGQCIGGTTLPVFYSLDVTDTPSIRIRCITSMWVTAVASHTWCWCYVTHTLRGCHQCLLLLSRHLAWIFTAMKKSMDRSISQYSCILPAREITDTDINCPWRSTFNTLKPIGNWKPNHHGLCLMVKSCQQCPLRLLPQRFNQSQLEILRFNIPQLISTESILVTVQGSDVLFLSFVFLHYHLVCHLCLLFLLCSSLILFTIQFGNRFPLLLYLLWQWTLVSQDDDSLSCSLLTHSSMTFQHILWLGPCTRLWQYKYHVILYI